MVLATLNSRASGWRRTFGFRPSDMEAALAASLIIGFGCLSCGAEVDPAAMARTGPCNAETFPSLNNSPWLGQEMLGQVSANSININVAFDKDVVRLKKASGIPGVAP